MPGGKLAKLIVSSGSGSRQVKQAHTPPPPPTSAPRFSGLASVKPTAQRSLYFSELNTGTRGPGQFFITVEGQQPKLFDAKNPPAITTHIGAVEDWTVSNRTGEAHAFHMHQIHFLVTAINGQPVSDPYMADTVDVPAWSGTDRTRM
jgi:FtsP/CotA-like multicopper oxidase with cupredoxin domain